MMLAKNKGVDLSFGSHFVYLCRMMGYTYTMATAIHQFSTAVSLGCGQPVSTVDACLLCTWYTIYRLQLRVVPVQYVCIIVRIYEEKECVRT